MSYRLPLVKNSVIVAPYFYKFAREPDWLYHLTQKEVDRRLEPWRARYTLGQNYIEFDTEADATRFILRWS